MAMECGTERPGMARSSTPDEVHWWSGGERGRGCIPDILSRPNPQDLRNKAGERVGRKRGPSCGGGLGWVAVPAASKGDTQQPTRGRAGFGVEVAGSGWVAWPAA